MEGNGLESLAEAASAVSALRRSNRERRTPVRLTSSVVEDTVPKRRKPATKKKAGRPSKVENAKQAAKKEAKVRKVERRDHYRALMQMESRGMRIAPNLPFVRVVLVSKNDFYEQSEEEESPSHSTSSSSSSASASKHTRLVRPGEGECDAKVTIESSSSFSVAEVEHALFHGQDEFCLDYDIDKAELLEGAKLKHIPVHEWISCLEGIVDDTAAASESSTEKKVPVRTFFYFVSKKLYDSAHERFLFSSRAGNIARLYGRADHVEAAWNITVFDFTQNSRFLVERLGNFVPIAAPHSQFYAHPVDRSEGDVDVEGEGEDAGGEIEV